MPKLTLPKDPTDLSLAVRSAMDIALQERNPLSVGWVLDYWYLQGVRNFKVISWASGTVQKTWESPDGQLQFVYEDLLIKYQRALGQLLGANMRPRCTRKFPALDSQRKAAVGQVDLDELTSKVDIDRIHLDVAQALMIFGTAGLACWVDSRFGVTPIGPRLEVVPPWQLLPIPGRLTLSSEAVGTVRHRWVGVDWLKEAQPRLKWPKEKEDARLQLQEVQAGSKVDEPALSTSLELVRPLDSSGGGGNPEATTHKQVELIEVWLHDENLRVDRYVVMLGRYVALDQKYEGDPEDLPLCPFRVERFNHTGGFWGRSFLAPLVPINQETERCWASLFKNTQDADQYGLLAIPNGMGITKEQLKRMSKPRAFFYEPNYTVPKMRPENLMPANYGDIPGRVANSGNQLMDRMSRESELYSGNAPGRVDTASGLGLLWETSSISLRPMAAAIARLFIHVYRVMLTAAPTMLSGRKSVILQTIDDAVAGIVVDPASGAMVLDGSNPHPQPDEVLITVREQNPRLLEQRKAELKEMLQLGLLDPEEFRWINYVENLGFPMGNKAEIEQRRTGMLRNIVQWGDGQTPGPVTYSPLDDHRIQVKVIRDFISQPTFTLGAPAVKDEFKRRLEFHESQLGGWPEPMPPPEDMGMLEQAGTWGGAGGGMNQLAPPVQRQINAPPKGQ